MDFSTKLSLALESVIDRPQRHLEPSVWVQNGTQYSLRPEVRAAIEQGFRSFERISGISKVLIIGGISTYNYSAGSDIDTNVEMPEATDQELAAAQQLTYKMNGQAVFGGHPLNWWVSTKLDQTRYDSAYDVTNDRWIRGPRRLNLDLTHYLDTFENTIKKIDLNRTELLHNVLELKILDDMSPEYRDDLGALMGNKLQEINKELRKGQSLYHNLIQDRRDAFANPNPTELAKYKAKSALPDNIIYLLLRKYCYLNYLSAIDKLQVPVQPTQLPAVKKATEQVFGQC